MGILNWNALRKRYNQNPISYTIKEVKFTVARVTDEAIYIDLPSGEQYISRRNLERAVELINEGRAIRNPTDYKIMIYDERPSYAWAILRDIGFTEQPR